MLTIKIKEKQELFAIVCVCFLLGEVVVASLDDVPLLSYSVSAGNPISVQCSGTKVTREEHVKRWYHARNYVEMVMTNRVSTDSNGTLRFAYTEVKDTGKYLCGIYVTSRYATSINFHVQVELKVTHHPISMTTPKTEISSFTTLAAVNRPVTLECYFSGYPVPEVTWRNGTGVRLTSLNQQYNITDFGRKLYFRSVKYSHAGNYSCRGENSAGHMTVNLTLTVLGEKAEAFLTLTNDSNMWWVLLCFAIVGVIVAVVVVILILKHK